MMTGKLVKLIRTRLGMTQVKFGKTVGVHSLTVSRWERGQHQLHGPALKFIEKMKKDLDQEQEAAE